MNPSRASLIIFCSFLLAVVHPTQAATVTWDGSTNQFWGVADNWTGNTVPVATDDVLFDGSATRFSVDLGNADRTVNDLTINSVTAYTFEDAVPGQSLTLNDVSVLSGFGHSFQNDVVLADSVSTWTVAGGAYMFVNGDISGSGGITKEGDGLLTLNNNMSYTGATTINDGTLAVATTKADGLANSAVTVNSGAKFTLDANGTGNSFNVGSLAGSGITDVDGGHTTFGGDDSSTTYSGTLRDGLGGGSVTKGGSGTWTLVGTLSGVDTVNVAGGTLVVADGNYSLLADSAVTIGSGAQLTVDDASYEDYFIGSLAGAGVLDFKLADLNIGSNDSSATFTGTLTFDTVLGGGALNKDGAGTWTLGGSGHALSGIRVNTGSVVIAGASGSFGALDIFSAANQTTIQNTTSAASFDYISNAATMTISGSSTVVELDSFIFNSEDSTFTVADGATLNAVGSFKQVNDGDFIVDEASVFFKEFGANKNGTISISDPTGGTALTIGGSGTDSSTFAGIIQDHTSGAGSVTKTGTNTITFSGANTYSGATLIEGGELIISNDNREALRNSAVTVDAGATLTFDDNTTAATYDVGSLAGSGTVDLEAGDLDFGFDNSSTTFSGTLIYDDVEGTGDLTKVGTGTWTLQGSGHDMGVVHIQNGAFVIDGASGQWTRITNDGTATTAIQNATNADFSSSLINSGIMTISGNSTVVDTSESISNSGTFTVEDGATLNIAKLFQQSSAGSFVVDAATLSFKEFATNKNGTISISDPTGGAALTIGGSGTDSSTFDGIIQDHTSGAGSVTKTGTNTITFSGANTYSGATTIQGGTLAGATFAGDLINTGGTFSPGTAYGVTTIGGDYSQASAGGLLLEIGGSSAGSSYDTLAVTGQLTLDGSLDVEFVDDYQPSAGDQYTLITYGSLTDNGVVTAVANLSAGLVAQLAWDAPSSSLLLDVDYSSDIAGFRLQYGLAADGSDDEDDWSGNGVANIFYHTFGLGDPNVANIDRTRLPSTTESGDSLIFSYIRRIDQGDVEIEAVSSTDLSNWDNLVNLPAAEAATNVTTGAEDSDHLRITYTFPIANTQRFFSVRTKDTE